MLEDAAVRDLGSGPPWRAARTAAPVSAAGEAEEPDEIEQYRLVLNHLRNMSLSCEDSLTLIGSIAGKL